MHIAVAVVAAVASSGTAFAVRCLKRSRENNQQVRHVQRPQQFSTAVAVGGSTNSSPRVDPQDAAQCLQQLQQERDELAQQLTQMQPYLRSMSARQRDSSNIQCLLQGLQQLHELTEQSYAISAQQVHSSTASITLHSTAAASQQLSGLSIPGHEAVPGALTTWGSEVRHTSTSDGGSPMQHSATPPVTEHQQQPQLLTLTSLAEAELAPAAPGALEEWGSGLWVRSSSTGCAAAGSRLSPTCSGIGAASRLPSRLAVVSSVGAVGLDSWGSGISPMHQQQHVGAAFTEEDEGAQQQEQHLAASEAMVAELQKQLAEAQEHGQLLQQLILQQHVEKQSLEQQVEQLQAFAQQQQDKLAHSEEIISRMQSLAGRLATIRMSRDGSSA